MRFSFTDEQEELRRGARRFLADYSSPKRVRRAMESESGYDRSVWRRIGRELGWSALIVPEDYDGCGLTHVELVALMEEMGRALLCAPFFSTVALATNTLLVCGTEQNKRDYVPRLAAGEATGTVAFVEADGRLGAGSIQTRFRSDGEDYVISGAKSYVVDGATADLIIVAARAVDTLGERGVELFVVPSDAAGLDRRALGTMDLTRRQAELRLDDVRVPASARLGHGGNGWSGLQRALDLARIALAAEQVGGAEACLEMSVDYALTRTQFGRPIGSFQAVKHMCADMLVQVESARSACYYAGWAASVGDDELPVLASLAKAYCSDAYFLCAGQNIQIHGGVGFTWEHDAHLYFKRAKSSEILLGDPSYHRAQVADRVGI